MKISASIYSNKEKPLRELVSGLDAHGIDMLHVDCVDDHKVFEDIRHIRSFSSTPIDLHIVSENPAQYLSVIEELKIEYVSFQYEKLNHIPVLSKNAHTKFGLSLISSTPVNVFEAAKDQFDFVMMMSTVPGQSGGIFNKDSFQRIIEFKNNFPKSKVHVDGGVNDEIAYILRLLGVHSVVSGSYLMQHESLGAGLLSFHQSSNSHTRFRALEFATPVSFLPTILESEVNFKKILLVMQQYALGFVLITDAEGVLKGVVSNADVRKGLLQNMDNLNATSAESVINQNPVCIREMATVADIIKQINELNFIVLFLPVVDEKNILKGAVLLNNLTRV